MTIERTHQPPLVQSRQPTSTLQQARVASPNSSNLPFPIYLHWQTVFVDVCYAAGPDEYACKKHHLRPRSGRSRRLIMELIPDETALSCPKYPSADFDKLIEDTILQRATLPSQRRILRVTSKRRKIAQSRQESGVPQDLHVSLHASSRSTSTTPL